MVTWPSHPKAKKLRLKLGDSGPLGFIYLLAYVGAYKPDGVLSGMDAEDIALAADYQGDPQEFCAVLVALRLLDLDDKTYVIHDWKDWNPYAAGAKERSEKARHAANVRHGKEKPPRTEDQSLTEKNDAPSTDEQCPEQQSALPPAPNSNAPSPSPHPSSVSNETGEKPPDPVKQIFDEGVVLLTKAGESEAKARQIVGQLRKALDDPEALKAIRAAQDKTDPATWLRACCQKPVKLPYDPQSLFAIRKAVGLPFEFDDTKACHEEIHSQLRKHPELRPKVEAVA